MRKSAKRLLRAVIVGGAIIAATGCPMAYADGGGENGADTRIANINNNNMYSFQGLGTLTLENVLGDAESFLLSPVRSVIGRLTP